MNDDIEKIEKLLDRHQKWLNKLPVPTEGCLYQMMNVIGEAQRLLEEIKKKNVVAGAPLPSNHLVFKGVPYVPYGHSKCLVCGKIHPNGLPCPEMKIT